MWKNLANFFAKPIHHSRSLSRLFFRLFYAFFMVVFFLCCFSVVAGQSLFVKLHCITTVWDLFTVFLQWTGECIHSLNIGSCWPDTLWECKPMLDFNKISMNSIDELFLKVVMVDLSCCVVTFVAQFYSVYLYTNNSHSHFVSISNLFTFEKQILFSEEQSEILFECSIENRSDFHLEIFSFQTIFFPHITTLYSFQCNRLNTGCWFPGELFVLLFFPSKSNNTLT